MEILDEEYDSYVEHHGVDGQKWGVKHGPPYPLESRSERRARKKEERTEKKRQKQRSSQLVKARKIKRQNKIKKEKEAKKAAKKEENEKKRREAILRDPKKLYRNRHKFQKEEIENALKRFEWEEKIHNYSTNRMANVSKNAENIVKTLDSGLKGYNKVASAYNAFVSDDNQLPIINIGKKKERGN